MQEWCSLAAQAALAKGAHDPVLLDVSRLIGVTDGFVITSGTSTRQVRTIVEEIERQLKATFGLPAPRSEGLEDARWVLLDYGDFVVHVFVDEARDFYQLEGLWGDAPRWDWVEPSALARP